MSAVHLAPGRGRRGPGVGADHGDAAGHEVVRRGSRVSKYIAALRRDVRHPVGHRAAVVTEHEIQDHAGRPVSPWRPTANACTSSSLVAEGVHGVGQVDLGRGELLERLPGGLRRVVGDDRVEAARTRRASGADQRRGVPPGSARSINTCSARASRRMPARPPRACTAATRRGRSGAR